MLRNTIFILLMIMSCPLIGQQDTTYEDFYTHRWELHHNWARQDVIILKSSPKNDSGKLEFGKFISFQQDKKVTYERFMFCPVGETFTNIENFIIHDNKVSIYYKTKSWNDGQDAWKEKHKEYRIIKYDNDTMVLKLI